MKKLSSLFLCILTAFVLFSLSAGPAPAEPEDQCSIPAINVI